MLLNLHLQQMAAAQSRGSNAGLMPWQLHLPLSQSGPPPGFPSQEQWRDAMMMQAARAGQAAGPAKVSHYVHVTQCPLYMEFLQVHTLSSAHVFLCSRKLSGS